MRKSDEEITSEVFGKGSRWIGWDNWLQHQPVFKYIEKKVEEGVSVLSTRHFMVRSTLDGFHWDKMIYVDINHRAGVLDRIVIPGSFDSKARLDVRAQSCTYKGDVINDVFTDPWRPTSDELDLFAMLFKDEQILIDMNQEFYATILHFNKAALKGQLKIEFLEQ